MQIMTSYQKVFYSVILFNEHNVSVGVCTLFCSFLEIITNMSYYYKKNMVFTNVVVTIYN